MTSLVFARDPDGRAFARSASDDASDESAVLADWLTQDVPWSDHALYLAAARMAITGNAYALTPDADTVLLHHLHRSDQPAVRVPRARFQAELSDWAAFLRSDGDQAETG